MQKHVCSALLAAVLIAPLPALAGDLCGTPQTGTPNHSHIQVKNATRDAGVWITAYRYAIVGRTIDGAWCVPPNTTDTHGAGTTIVTYRFEVTQPNCAHPVRLDREVRGGDATRSGTIYCKVTIAGSKPNYNIIGGE